MVNHSKERTEAEAQFKLVMNALKHAFPNDQSDGRITVGYVMPQG
jgi:hypothetical protein